MHSNLPLVSQASNVHFDRIGGDAGIHRLVDAFYRAMDTRDDARTLRAMHAQDLAPTQAVLVKYLGEWMGGGKTYSAERGPPALRRRHLHFALDASARDAWMACMRQALAETCTDTALIAELDAAFWKIADHLRNI
ncbi:MAG: group II truncated hemoglobin [Burkholderiales bacterium]|nr:group II truncated hemoglobin [Burkholderiales bacterium]